MRCDAVTSMPPLPSPVPFIDEFYAVAPSILWCAARVLRCDVNYVASHFTSIECTGLILLLFQQTRCMEIDGSAALLKAPLTPPPTSLIQRAHLEDLLLLLHMWSWNLAFCRSSISCVLFKSMICLLLCTVVHDAHSIDIQWL